MTFLVTGGAGYIGSHATLMLSQAGHEVVVADNLSMGHADAVLGAKLYVGDLRDKTFVEKVFDAHQFDAVFNFAACSLVAESMANPLKYYEVNVGSMVNLLQAMVAKEVKYMVQSSTASVYGQPKQIPITEQAEKSPTNTYGESKLAIEKMLGWADVAHGIKSVSLRYFNVAGADASGKIGERHNPETHLIPNILKAALTGNPVTIFGDDYDTKDGSCIRDYIHVTDLIDAHILAYQHLARENVSGVFNLGSGGGYSNLEILDISREITGIDIKATIAGRRPGDPATLIASSELARNVLGWQPQHEDLRKMVGSAWAFYKANGGLI